jgi:Protein kinase domain
MTLPSSGIGEEFHDADTEQQEDAKTRSDASTFLDGKTPKTAPLMLSLGSLEASLLRPPHVAAATTGSTAPILIQTTGTVPVRHNEVSSHNRKRRLRTESLRYVGDDDRVSGDTPSPATAPVELLSSLSPPPCLFPLHHRLRHRHHRCIAFWNTLVLLFVQKQICLAAAAATITTSNVNQHTQQKQPGLEGIQTFSADSVHGEIPEDEDAQAETGNVLFPEDDGRAIGDHTIDHDVHDEYLPGKRRSHNAAAHQQQQNDQQQRQHDPVIVVSTVDGTLAGLSRTTGRTLWKRMPNSRHQPSQRNEQQGHSPYRMKPTATATGGTAAAAGTDTSNTRDPYESPPSPLLLEPLVSTTTTVGRYEGSTSRWKTAAVPSIRDHMVYLTAPASSGPDQYHSHPQQEQHVTAHVRDLVERAPFMDSRGRLYTGQRRNVVVAISTATGEILQEIPSSDNSNSASLFSSRQQNKDQADDDVLWIGRVDYSVSIHEPRSGELDVQFRSSELLSVQDMLLDPGAASGSDSDVQYHPVDLLQQRGHQQQHLLPQVASGVQSSGEGRVGDEDKNGQYTTASSEPPRKLFSLVATPSGNVAYQDLDTGKIVWVAQEIFATPVAYALDSSTGASLELDIVPDAIVPDGTADYVSKEMQRQLELRTHSISDDLEPETIVGSLPGSGQLFAMPLGKQKITGSEIKPHTATMASSVAMTKQQHGSFVSSGRRTASHSSFGHDNTIHHQLGGTHQRQYHCTPGSSQYPHCLAERRKHPSQRNFLTGPAGHAFQRDGAIVPFFHPDFGYQYMPMEHWHESGHPQTLHQNRKKYQKIFRVLGSWLPPLIALIFVSSFELGRRKRLKDIGVDGDSSKDVVSLTQGQKSDENGGIIEICEDVILGHGGHGTVVYKGVLDGRQVAVKRMLKTYHASADREISLLIESDGHPNVVRYFLKEIRGDFVYLALELCDLSLHDLIGHIRSRLDRIGNKSSDNEEKERIFEATKSIIFQIVNGVYHLHQNRIM